MKKKVRCPACNILCTIEGKTTQYYLPIDKKRRGNKIGKDYCCICGGKKWI